MEIKDLGPTFKQVINRHLSFVHDNKVIRDGILVGFSARGFNLKFDLKKNDTVKPLELPYPFNISKDKHSLIFDYKVSHIEDIIVEDDLEAFIEDNGKAVSPFYNSTIRITLSKS